MFASDARLDLLLCAGTRMHPLRLYVESGIQPLATRCELYYFLAAAAALTQALEHNAAAAHGVPALPGSERERKLLFHGQDRLRVVFARA